MPCLHSHDLSWPPPLSWWSWSCTSLVVDRAELWSHCARRRLVVAFLQSAGIADDSHFWPGSCLEIDTNSVAFGVLRGSYQLDMLLVEAFPLSVCVVCAHVYRCVCLCIRFHFILPGAVLDYNLSPKMLIVQCALPKVLLCKLSPITINLLPSAIQYITTVLISCTIYVAIRSKPIL